MFRRYFEYELDIGRSPIASLLRANRVENHENAIRFPNLAKYRVSTADSVRASSFGAEFTLPARKQGQPFQQPLEEASAGDLGYGVDLGVRRVVG